MKVTMQIRTIEDLKKNFPTKENYLLVFLTFPDDSKW
jgi:hypothetical protein